MGYIVSITRKEGAGITTAELKAAIEKDPQLSIATETADEPRQAMVIQWRPDPEGAPCLLVLSNGRIDVATPSNATLKKMQALARQLEASVIGEEGEDLTDVAVPDAEPPGCGLAVIALLLAPAAFLICRL